MDAAVRVRASRAEDYDRVIAVVDAWWGRAVSQSLPRLFLDQFWSTSRVAEDDSGLAAFLIGFVSPSLPRLGYVHFAGVRRDHRRSRLARALYEQFTSLAQRRRCTEVRAVRAPGRRRLHPLLRAPGLQRERPRRGLQRLQSDPWSRSVAC